MHRPTFSGVFNVTDFTEVHRRHQSDPLWVDGITDEARCIGAVLLQVRQRQRMCTWYGHAHRLTWCRRTSRGTTAWQGHGPATEKIISERWWRSIITVSRAITTCPTATVTRSLAHSHTYNSYHSFCTEYTWLQDAYLYFKKYTWKAIA